MIRISITDLSMWWVTNTAGISSSHELIRMSEMNSCRGNRTKSWRSSTNALQSIFLNITFCTSRFSQSLIFSVQGMVTYGTWLDTTGGVPRKQYPEICFVDTLQWRHNGRDGVSNHHPHHCLLNSLFRSKITPKHRVTDLCAGNSPVTGEFPAQKASNAENVSIRWRHHEELILHQIQSIK